MDKIMEIDNKNIDNIKEGARKKLKDIKVPTWKRVGYNFSNVDVSKDFNGLSFTSKLENKIDVKIKNKETFNREISGVTYLENLNLSNFNSGVIIDEALDDISIVNRLNEQDNVLQDLNYIRVPRGKKAKVTFEYLNEKCKGFSNSVTKILVEEDAELVLVNLQRFSNAIESFNSVEVEVKDRAIVRQFYIDLGGEISSSSVKLNLIGEGVISEVYSLYMADLNKKLDLEYSTYHYGRRGDSLIEGHGVVKDQATKVFRGNVYFEKGSSNSIGKERESAVLLDKGVKADSIPTLFCKEDNVVGEHAASAGQLNENRLFYLMSRGLTERDAKRMIAISAFKPILEKIDGQNIIEKVMENIEKRI